MKKIMCKSFFGLKQRKKNNVMNVEKIAPPLVVMTNVKMPNINPSFSVFALRSERLRELYSARQYMVSIAAMDEYETEWSILVITMFFTKNIQTMKIME